MLLHRSNQFSFLRNACGGKEIARRMLDRDLQQRFASRCTDAALGYSAASTAAYAAFADQVLNFWSAVLQPPASSRSRHRNCGTGRCRWRRPPPPPTGQFNPFNPFDWMSPAAAARPVRAPFDRSRKPCRVPRRYDRSAQRHERHPGPPARAGHQPWPPATTLPFASAPA